MAGDRDSQPLSRTGRQLLAANVDADGLPPRVGDAVVKKDVLTEKEGLLIGDQSDRDVRGNALLSFRRGREQKCHDYQNKDGTLTAARDETMTRPRREFLGETTSANTTGLQSPWNPV